MTEEIKCGIYRHYKGHLYQVLGLAHDANDQSRTCVVYIGLELDSAHLGPRLAVRTLEDFTSTVPYEDDFGMAFPDSKTTGAIQRFVYLGPVLTQEMLDVD